MRFWEELERTRPDIILLDVDMPGINGVDLCRVLRNDRRWAAAPVLFLTAHRDEQIVAEMFAAGADDYLLKPVRPDELRVRIRNRLDRFKLHRLLAETDALTGVPNRASSAQGVERMLRMAKRREQPLSLGILDLDRFKAINDRHGHAAGDAVLLGGAAAGGAQVAAEACEPQIVPRAQGPQRQAAVAHGWHQRHRVETGDFEAVGRD